jgi:hypothetical protein
MEQKNDIVERALVNQGQKMIARARLRTVLSLALLCCGGVLLYVGLSGQQHLFTTIGIIFVMYALFMRFHVRRTKAVMAELETGIAKLTQADKTKEQGDAPQNPGA